MWLPHLLLGPAQGWAVASRTEPGLMQGTLRVPSWVGSGFLPLGGEGSAEGGGGQR